MEYDTSPSEEEDECYNDDEMPPLEYARFYELTVDYHLDTQVSTCRCPTPESMWNDMLDPHGVPSIDQHVRTDLLNEKWDIDREAAKFLASVVGSIKHATTSEDIDFENFGSRGLKLVEAVLPTDPATDLLHLKQRNELRLSFNGERPLELDRSKGEDPSWTAAELGLPAKLQQQVARERLDVDRDTVIYLQDCCQPGTLENALSATEIKKPTTIVPLTPPLLPLSPEHMPICMTGPVAELPLTSTPEDLIALEAASLGAQIALNDELHTPEASEKAPNTNGEMDAYLAKVMKTPSSPCASKRIRDLEAEVPILPVAEPLAKRVKTVSFPDCLHEVIPTFEFEIESDLLEQDTDTSVAGILAPLAKPAFRAIEEEQLDEVDTVMRVAVPSLAETQLYKPWEDFRSDPASTPILQKQSDFMLRMKHDFCRGSEKWSGATKVEKQLSWVAFPFALAKIKEEEFDDGSLARYMAGMSFDEEIDVDCLIAYQLPEDDADDELEYLQHDPALSASPSPVLPVTKAIPSPLAVILPIAEAAETQSSTGGPVMSMQQLLQMRKVELETVKQSEARAPVHDHHAGEGNAPSRSVGATGNFQAVGGISNFLRMHGKPVHEVVETAQGIPPPLKPQDEPAAPPTLMPRVEKEAEILMPEPVVAIPTPTPARIDDPFSIVISSSLITKRKLLRSIQAVLPTVELIERTAISDRAVDSTTGLDSNEADITINASTGIILTTLQKVKQKPLPGQRNFSSVPCRVASVAVRYARLIVLVSEGQQSMGDTDGAPALKMQLDDRDTDVLADLAASSIPNGTDVQAIYVPGGEPEVAAWIVALISRSQQPGHHTKLLSEETMWERLLRQAGLNAFAAQEVLVALKQPESHDGVDANSASYGITEFVRMSAEQRRARVGEVVKNDHVLEAVSRVVDGQWSKR